MEAIVGILAWPAVVLSLGILALCLLRGSLGDLIRRTKTLKTPGGSIELEPAAEAGAQAQVAATHDAPKNPLTTPAFVSDDTFLPPLIKEMSEMVLADPRLKDLPNDAARLTMLARHLAFAQAGAYFEAVYRLIFNSQISAIREANALSGIDLDRARQIHTTAETIAPRTYAHLPFDQWLGYIGPANAGLVRVNNDRVVVTVRGQELLRYLLLRQYDDKPYNP
jgi:hypothetical protein